MCQAAYIPLTLNADPGWLHDEGWDDHVWQVPAMTWVPALEDLGATGLLLDAEACGEALARAHARSGARLLACLRGGLVIRMVAYSGFRSSPPEEEDSLRRGCAAG